MTATDLQRFIQGVQRNCEIANARHAHEATMCTYLLQMRELYHWERGLPLAEQPARAEVSRWLAEREAAWREMEADAYQALPLGGRDHDPFDAEALNRELLAQGLVYGAGYGRFQRPHFFLAQLEADERREGKRVLVAGREHARDIAAIPAALQGDAIFVRRDALRRWLWEKVDFWRARRPAGALAAALECWGLAAGDDAAFERMVEAESETLILHELGEARAGAALGGAWEDMLAGLEDRRVEILARAVRDNLADCLSTLPALIARDDRASLHFWFSQLEGMRREIFPALGRAYAAWRDSGRAAALSDTIRAGAVHWERVAHGLLASRVGADARAVAL